MTTFEPDNIALIPRAEMDRLLRTNPVHGVPVFRCGKDLWPLPQPKEPVAKTKKTK